MDLNWTESLKGLGMDPSSIGRAECPLSQRELPTPPPIASRSSSPANKGHPTATYHLVFFWWLPGRGALHNQQLCRQHEALSARETRWGRRSRDRIRWGRGCLQSVFVFSFLQLYFRLYLCIFTLLQIFQQELHAGIPVRVATWQARSSVDGGKQWICSSVKKGLLKIVE